MKLPVCLAALALAAASAAAEPPSLRFAADGETLRAVGLETLRSRCAEQRVEVDDPYYERRKSFLAVPLSCALALGFDRPADALGSEEFALRALDGYTRPATGAQLLEKGGFLAFADAQLTSRDDPAAAPAWEPIARQGLDPAPFYVIWAEPGQNDPHRYPWPFQLATIENVAFEARYPHTLPRSAPEGSPAWTGFDVFRRECVACHSINDEGGKVGPDLNIPRSIVEYRPREQIAAFIRDPAAFRYTTMPAHPHLSDDEMEGLLAYFTAMSRAKHDPRASPEAAAE